MLRVLPGLAAIAVALAAAPAPADAARPAKGSFYNSSPSNGLYLENTRKKVRTLWLFCTKAEHEERQNRYVPRRPIKIRRSGRFTYRGVANRFGPEGQWLGHFKVRLRGRFTSDDRVVIKRRLSGCGRGTAVASRQS